MRKTSPAAVALAVLLTTAPAFAGYTPLGNWRCDVHGKPAGMLTVTGSSYSFLAPGANAAQPGALRIEGDLVYVLSGPLKDLRIALGHYATLPDLAPYIATGDWASQLVFNLGAGNGMACAPSYDDNAL